MILPCERVGERGFKCQHVLGGNLGKDLYTPNQDHIAGRAIKASKMLDFVDGL